MHVRGRHNISALLLSFLFLFVTLHANDLVLETYCTLLLALACHVTMVLTSLGLDVGNRLSFRMKSSFIFVKTVVHMIITYKFYACVHARARQLAHSR